MLRHKRRQREDANEKFLNETEREERRIKFLGIEFMYVQ